MINFFLRTGFSCGMASNTAWSWSVISCRWKRYRYIQSIMIWASPARQRVRRHNGGRRTYISHLLLLPQGKETNTRYLHNLEAYSGNITLGFTTATETRNENLIILIHKVQATVILPQCQHCSHRQNMPHTGTKAVTFFPFLMSCTRTHLRMAELGCLASTPTFSSTIPFAWEEPPVGDVL